MPAGTAARTGLQITSVRSGASSGSRDFWWSGSDLGFLLRLVPGTAGAGECVPRRPSRGHAAVPRRERAVPRRGCGARHPGLLALRSANGLGPPAGTGGPAPTAFNRAGEKVRATRGRLPRVICEAGPRRVCGLAVPSSGRRSRAPVRAQEVKRWSGGLRRAAGGAGGDSGSPAGAVDDHGVDPAQQRGGARDPGLRAPRAGRGRHADLP